MIVNQKYDFWGLSVEFKRDTNLMAKDHITEYMIYVNNRKLDLILNEIQWIKQELRDKSPK